MQRLARLLTLCCVLSACSDSSPSITFEPEALAVPAAQPGKGPRISGSDATGLTLTWMEPGESHTTLKYSTYLHGQWSAGARVVDVEDMFVNWADLPSVVPISGDRLAAHWLQKSADLTYAYDVMFSQSLDKGATWSEPIRPHTDGTPTEHGFVSMFSHGDGTGLIWLDGRKTVNEVGDDPATSGMTLRGGTIDANLSLRSEQLIDELTCDCCQTDVAVASSGPVAVYRDRSVEEIRDIYVTRLVDGKWTAGHRIAADNWEIPGCPVNGPSIDAAGATVAVAWFTAADDRPVVKVSFSRDNGEHFSMPVEITAGSVLGRVGIAYLDGDRAAVSWLQRGDGEERHVLVRSITADGELGPVHTVTRDAGAFAMPQLAAYGDDIIFVWTESADSVDRIVSARVPIAAL